MKVAVVDNFKGEAPRIAARSLPDALASATDGPRLLTTNVGPWAGLRSEYTTTKSLPINTIYKLANEFWLEWSQSELAAGAVEVDVAKGVVPGDTTHRTFITGLDVPRWTDLALATTGSPPYPVETRKLGVPAPDTAATVFAEVNPGTAVTVTDDCSGPSPLSNWTISPTINAGGKQQLVEVDAVVGNPAPSYKTTTKSPVLGPGAAAPQANMWRDFGYGSSVTVHWGVDFRFDMTTGHDWFARAWLAAGAAEDQTTVIQYGRDYTGQTTRTTPTSTVVIAALTEGDWYRLSIDAHRNTASNATYNFTLTHVSSGSVVDSGDFTGGFGGGWMGLGSVDFQVDPTIVWFDNIEVQASGFYDSTADDIATNYVYTFVNDVGQESAPSPVSVTVLKDDDTQVRVTTPTTADPDYGITTKRIYRAVTGLTGTSYQFVAEIPLAQADYTDSLTDVALGEVLESDDWDMPPANLRGILALPNGIMVAFQGNELCFSAQNHPHAWPVRYRLTTDHDIVGLGAIDTTIVILTTVRPYTAAGNAPDSYSMAVIEDAEGCVSKRSIASIRGFGVLYASPSGLQRIAGMGSSPENLTLSMFTKEQWQALEPTTIISAVNDARYFACYVAGGVGRTLVMDFNDGGFGLIHLELHATAMFESEDGVLYMALDRNVEPSTPLNAAPDAVPADGHVIYGWADDPSSLRAFNWTSKVYMPPNGLWPAMARVEALDYDDLVLTTWVDGVQQAQLVVASAREFMLPARRAFKTFQFGVTGTSEVQRVQIVEQVEDLI